MKIEIRLYSNMELLMTGSIFSEILILGPLAFMFL